MQQRPGAERSIGELFADLARNTTTLVRQEIQLARTEVTQKVTQAGREVGLIGVGGALAYAGLLALIAAVIIGLGEFIPLWLSALLVGLVVVGIAYVVIQRGLRALKQIDLTPRQTIESLKDDTAVVKEHTR